VITADDLRKSASSSLPEILAQFGLVHIRDNSGTPNQQVDLRGFGITGDQNTLILVDGLRISENELTSAQLNAIALESIERIEIVRGSGAVLYGGGATGGTLTLGGAWNVDRHDLAADLSYRNKNASALFLPSFFHTNVNVWSFAPRAKLRFDAFGRTHDVTLGADWERWDYDNRNTASGEQTN